MHDIIAAGSIEGSPSIIAATEQISHIHHKNVLNPLIIKGVRLRREWVMLRDVFSRSYMRLGLSSVISRMLCGDSSTASCLSFAMSLTKMSSSP